MNFEVLNSLKPVAKHLLITVGSGVIIVLFFFYGYLPSTTNHGETITVPDVQNQHLNDLEDILVGRNLRYTVNADSGYNADQEPLTVIDQFPKANSQVKENRRIYVTLNARKPPLVKMPDLKDKSLMISQITLQSYGLKLGKIDYRPDMAPNVVLDQLYEGKSISAGTMIPKGAKIDLYIGDGFGNRFWQMYDYTSQPFEDAKVGIVGIGLTLGRIEYVKNPEAVVKSVSAAGDTISSVVNVSRGAIVRQYPLAGRTVRLQDVVDLWIYQPDAAPKEETILEEN
jgi:beta-lactam-binding protein with PASTA domain